MIYRPLGYEQITDVSAAVALTVPDTANRVLVQASAQAVRWRDDGTDPTDAVGMSLAAGETLAYEGDLSALKFIEQVAGAILDVNYYANWFTRSE